MECVTAVGFADQCTVHPLVETDWTEPFPHHLSTEHGRLDLDRAFRIVHWVLSGALITSTTEKQFQNYFKHYYLPTCEFCHLYLSANQMAPRKLLT